MPVRGIIIVNLSRHNFGLVQVTRLHKSVEVERNAMKQVSGVNRNPWLCEFLVSLYEVCLTMHFRGPSSEQRTYMSKCF